MVTINVFVILPCCLDDVVRGRASSRLMVAILRNIVHITIFLVCVILVSEAGSVGEAFVCRKTRRGYVGYVRRKLRLGMRGMQGDSGRRGEYKADFLFFIVVMDVVIYFFVATGSRVIEMLLQVTLLPLVTKVSCRLVHLTKGDSRPMVGMLDGPKL